jgi:ribosomal protein S18 acetylase RimI-like enzyme
VVVESEETEELTILEAPPDAAEVHALVGAYFAELRDRVGDQVAFAPGPTAGSSPVVGDTVFLLARAGSAFVGCVGVRPHGADAGEVKHLWVDPAHRRRGIAYQLLSRLESDAASRGVRRLVLDTRAELVEALALYRRAGYRAVTAYNDNPHATHWFEKILAPRRVVGEEGQPGTQPQTQGGRVSAEHVPLREAGHRERGRP